MAWPVFSALQTIVASGQTGHYASFPHAFRTAAGTRIVAFRDWDGSTTATHSTGGAAWIIRNEGSPVKLWDNATFGGTKQVQDTFVYANPANSAQIVYLIRCDDSGVQTHFYSLSTDEGVTWSAPASLPAVAVPSGNGWNVIGEYSFFDFLPSLTGSKLYATLYGVRSGYGFGTSVAVAETTDGLNWSVRSWPLLAVSTKADETGLIRCTDGRILAVLRNGANGSDGYTCYSDDDGLTWSAPSLQSDAKWHAPRGFALNSNEVCIICRDFDVNRFNGYSTAFWVLTTAGVPRSKSVHIWKISNPSHGAYVSPPILESDGQRYVYLYSDFGSANPGLYKAMVTRCG